MISKSRYYKLFEQYISYTDEKEATVREILKLIQPRSEWNFLDVGCGNGYMTIPTAVKVSQSVGIDINEHQLEQARKSAKRAGANIRFINSDWMDVELNEKFDFILSSHALYSPYFSGRMEKAIKKMLDCLAENGNLMIVHYSMTGNDYTMLKQFWQKINGTPIPYFRNVQNYKYVVAVLRKFGYKPKTKRLITYVTLPSIEESLFLVEWIFGVPYPKLAPDVQKEVINYLSRLKKRGKIVVSWHHNMVWVKK
jgi:ubiquinone/menaquinone biosynthesis C-methylase UbiE